MPGGELEGVARAITERLGIAPTAEQMPELSRLVAARTAARGCSLEHYAARLDDAKELQAVAAQLTIPETFFFRFPALWDALRDKVLPALRARARGQGRRARCWSAGCCTGEEPYTLAMLVAETGGADEVDILATDVNEAYLERAAAGRFSPRSVRRVPGPMADKYFKRRSGAFWLEDSIRRRVRFAKLNLAGGSFPSAANGTSGLDLILCQNVLIYFDARKAKETLERLSGCLEEEGLLALGPSEMAPAGGPLVSRQFDGAFFCARARPTLAPPAPAATENATKAERQETISSPVQQTGQGDPGDDLKRVETLLEEGRQEDARILCVRRSEARPLEAWPHYLLGLIDYDNPEQAGEHFRKVLYLDPGHLLARLHLARCAERLGRSGEAAREFENLSRLAAQRPPDELLDAKEGLTCGMLSSISRRKGHPSAPIKEG